MGIELEEFVMYVNNTRQKSLVSLFHITMDLTKNGIV